MSVGGVMAIASMPPRARHKEGERTCEGGGYYFLHFHAYVEHPRRLDTTKKDEIIHINNQDLNHVNQPTYTLNGDFL